MMQLEWYRRHGAPLGEDRAVVEAIESAKSATPWDGKQPFQGD